MDDITNVDVVLFDDMVRRCCQECDSELTWTMVMEEPASKLVYLASCCEVRYRAHLHQVVITSIFETHGPPRSPSTICQCGHEEAEHDRDRGCSHVVASLTDLFGTERHVETCGCWIYRNNNDEEASCNG